MNYLSQVDEFHRAFQYKQPTPTTPDISDSATNNLREDLIREEFDELQKALTDGDRVGVLDALCDLQYVLSGAVLALGYGGVFDDAFAEVHRSNLSKAWTASEMEDWLIENPTSGELIFVNGEHGYIARRKDGKIVKSPSFSPPDLDQFVD